MSTPETRGLAQAASNAAARALPDEPLQAIDPGLVPIDHHALNGFDAAHESQDQQCAGEDDDHQEREGG